MHRVITATDIDAPIELCFDLARDMHLHVKSAAATGERLVGGRTSGLIELGDEVVFEARHLGVRQRLAARVTAFDRPRHFRDEMTRGAFRSLTHDHHFETLPNGLTRMTDVLQFAVPLGLVGWPVGRWVIGPHLSRFLRRRGVFLKAEAEALAKQ